jgi:hypothetical protein
VNADYVACPHCNGTGLIPVEQQQRTETHLLEAAHDRERWQREQEQQVIDALLKGAAKLARG